LEDRPTSGGEGGVSCCGVVPTTGVHCDQLGDAESGGGALLQQTRDGGAVDQGRQAGGQDDAAFLSSVSLQSSAAGAEPAGLQSGQFVAAADAAPTNRELVSDQFAATAGEDRRAIGEACTLLLTLPRGRTSEPAAVRGDAGSDLAVADTDGIERWWSA